MTRAIRVLESGGIDTMRLDEPPRPEPGAGEMLVEAGKIAHKPAALDDVTAT